jgi:bacterioferritin-associated ferredoxin
MIICVCHNVNERAIHRAVEAGCACYEDLQMALGVGTCCGQCAQAAQSAMAEVEVHQPTRFTMIRIATTVQAEPAGVFAP